MEGYEQYSTLQLFSLNSQLVLEKTFDAGEIQLQLGHLTGGVYFFKMSSVEGVLATGKVVVR